MTMTPHGGNLKRKAVSLAQHARYLLAGRPHARAEIEKKLSNLCWKRRTKYESNISRLQERRKDLNLEASKERAKDEFEKCMREAASAVQHQLHDNNDVHFATWHILQRQSHRPRSEAELRSEICSRGVSSADFQQGLQTAEYDEVKAASEIAQAKNRLGWTQARVEKHLRSRGFPQHTIAGAISTVWGARGEPR